MSNKDINNIDESHINSEIDLSMKDSMHLFSYSLLKSKTKRTLSPYFNSFKYYFSNKNNKDDIKISKNNKNKLNNSSNNRKISLIDGDNYSSLKTLNIEVPTSINLYDEEYRNNFMNEYENSFAHYCGINKKQFTEIYINNRYIPVLNEFGDINISIKSIIDLLKTYSINVKAGKKILKRNRIKKIFKTQRKKVNLEKNKKTKHIFEVLNLNILQNNKSSEIKKNNFVIKNMNINDNKNKETINKEINNDKIDKLDDLKKENYNQISNLITIESSNNNFHGGRFGINNNKINKIISLRDKGKNLSVRIPNKISNQNQKQPLSKISGFPNNISSLGLGNMIPKSNLNMNNNSLIFNYNTISNDGNKKFLINNNNPTPFGLGISAIPPIQEGKQKNLSPSNNNIFNFNNNNIQNFQNINYSTPVNGNNLNSNLLSTNMNNNLNYNPMLSPRYFFNNNIDLYSPFSPFLTGSNFSSPRVISPNFNNNIFQDRFIYNNVNGNSFYFGNNSPMTINNNININNNNIINNNIINKNNNNSGNKIENDINNNINNNNNNDNKNNNNFQNNNNVNNFLNKKQNLNLKIDLNSHQ